MEFILSFPLGIILGWILFKIGKEHFILTYLVGILPYSIFFWLSWQDRDFWGTYRIAALLGSIISLIVWKMLTWRNEHNKKQSTN